jgi:hypothetical protein
MEERKTQQTTTPHNHVVILKEYISAGDFLDLNEESEKNSLTRTALAKRTLELAIISIDGSSENIPETLRNLPLGDYTFLQKEVKKLIEGDFTEAKSPAQS